MLPGLPERLAMAEARPLPASKAPRALMPVHLAMVGLELSSPVATVRPARRLEPIATEHPQMQKLCLFLFPIALCPTGPKKMIDPARGHFAIESAARHLYLLLLRSSFFLLFRG